MHIVRFKKRLFMTIFGVSLSGVGVAFMSIANFGLDPFQTFAHGIANLFPISFGTLYVFINAALLIADFFLDWHYIGVATFFNLFLLGYIVDFFTYLLNSAFPDPSMFIRILFLIIGLGILCFAAALYFTSDLGVSTFDALIQVVADRKILSFRMSFIVLDMICVIIGAITGCLPGVGTLITAFCMGPLVDFICVTVARPFLWGRNAEYTPVIKKAEPVQTK